MKKAIASFLIFLFSLHGICFADLPSSMVKSSWEANPGTSWDRMESTTGWVAAGSTAAVSANTAGTNVKEGLGSVNFAFTSFNTSATFTKDMTTPVDFTNLENIVFWQRFTGSVLLNLQSYTIQLSSVSDFSKNLTYTFTNPDSFYPTNLRVRWQRVLLAKSQFTNNGSEDISALRYIRFSMTSTAGGNATMTVDDIRYGYALNKAKVIITFDDGYLNHYTNAYPVLTSNNQKAVFGIVGGSIAGISAAADALTGESRKMNMTQIRDLYNAGHDIVNHSQAHLDADTITSGQQLADIDDTYDFLLANGFYRSARFYLMPVGTYRSLNIGTLPNLFTANIRPRSYLTRSTHPMPSIQPAIWMNENDDFANNADILPCFYVKNAVSTGTVTALIDKAITAKGLVILLFHGIINNASTPDQYQYKIADFTTISNYLKTKQDAGTLDVVRLSDYYKSFIHAESF